VGALRRYEIQNDLESLRLLRTLLMHSDVSLPSGEGLKFIGGSKLDGRPFDEEAVLKKAYAYEQNTPWHYRKPPI